MDPVEKIVDLIEVAIPDAQVSVDTLDGVHFSVVVVSRSFADMSRLEQHRLVMNALQESLAKEEIHAVGLKTYTPDAYERLRKI